MKMCESAAPLPLRERARNFINMLSSHLGGAVFVMYYCGSEITNLIWSNPKFL